MYLENRYIFFKNGEQINYDNRLRRKIKELKEKWKKTIKNWKIIQSQITDLFGERYTKYLEI